jgi:hypothetical protein
LDWAICCPFDATSAVSRDGLVGPPDNSKAQRGVEATASVLCDAERKHLDKQTATTLLESHREPTATLSSIAEAVFNDAPAKLKLAGPSREISMAEVLSGLQKTGAPLFEDSITDPAGAPYLKVDRTQVSCGTRSH